jgi:signal transduction histidine kinase/DNA-binding response OmpR family regulator
VLLAPGSAWPLLELRDTRAPILVDDLVERLRGHEAGAERLPPETAWLHPLRHDAENEVVGALVLGVHPRVVLDDRLREFLALAGDTVSARVAEAHARRRELDRLERLAELDRAKTEFFSNVSHEFRTPLTLMLGPLDAALDKADALPTGVADELEVARRNARRLLRLTGALLDFSQVEAGRLRAHFAPTDMAARTGEIVAQFQSAVDRAGLQLTTSFEPLGEPVWLDTEMWEKVVSNLLSNALKFTWEGAIEVTIRKLPKHAELIVRDTGVGIPAEELPFIFKRFHRVRDARARSHEGAGIGLALVDELVRRHHGRIRATSTVGSGTTVTIWLPLGRRPVVAERTPRPAESGLAVAEAMSEEASHWARDARLREGAVPEVEPFDDASASSSLRPYAAGARILVVDDNADMRDYLARLFGTRWEVSLAGDGEEALALARGENPDLVVADVMMPGLDGFALLKALRADEGLRRTPVMLVTARAGEESAIEGLLAGADDYVVKPFSARELLARAGAQLELARLRRRDAELNAFRVRLSDGLRALEDPVEIKRLACRMLVEQLGSERAHFTEIDLDARAFVVEGNYGVPESVPISGRFPMAGFEPFASQLQAGVPYAVEDVESDPRFPPETRESFLALHARAATGIPILRGGEFCALLNVAESLPRAWQEDELALMEEVAGRAWAEVERARAQQAMRAGL